MRATAHDPAVRGNLAARFQEFRDSVKRDHLLWVLLALGPFFIAFLLFDGTRGLFEGWLRVLAGTFLGAVGSAVVLGVELALLEPWLGQLLALRAVGQSIPGVPVELCSFLATEPQ